MIPSDEETLKKMQELADRNIARGDWGDEVRMPLEDRPMTPAERSGTSVLKKIGRLKLPKK